MIQELLGGSNVNRIVGGERSKLSTPPILEASPSHNSPSSSSSSPAPHATAPENLRCPRCDSSNTKFCYYNNYNLTQPRHFCRTCRRYWTKGGALRNVPIGGGCRKTRNTTVTAAVEKSSAAGKFKTVVSEMAKTGIFSCSEPADALSANPILWATSQNSHFLFLLRPQTQNPNPNNLQNPISIKEQGMLFGSSHLGTSESSISNTSANAMSAGDLGMDPFGPAHLPSSSLYRNQTLSGHGIMNNGLQELYQRLRLSSSCHPEDAPVILGSMASATSAILDSAPVATGELGFWNSTASWATDMSTTHGAYP